MNKLIVIIVVIFVFLTLCCICIQNNRYVTLYTCEPSMYISNYKTLPNVTSERVVISFTTIPSKISKLKPMLISLLDQTARVNQIFLTIPYTYKGKKYEIPEYMKDIVTILPTGQDYGRYTSLIPVLLREKDTNTVIISITDRYVYNKSYIKNVVSQVDTRILTNADKTHFILKPSMVITEETNGLYIQKWMDSQKDSFRVIKEENITLL